ncbi:MAG: aminomethyl-transferring glycine dehydrogenase subunit GcvPA [Chloroflexota bacterium]|nr:aminomethyl-transferring glycine dehydrogenase subunit GcvPA [Chloroflexota bacterium]MDE2702972.1 aminomethyl-transferring glycine dehydrogenase subunit GcvPA [Chloroflexota bacterium]MDE2936065.1 aminomethyl-transferring glycine dehydrogenase subunit GcvPA [Chloroflexota bacterium]MXY12532.1 aminomethyl-transferring glycine dehydrogenase subunit GcvPA [Chloroflexota bacterium]
MSYAPNTADDQKVMLDAIGVPAIDDLFVDIPSEHRDPKLGVGPPMAEMEVLEHLGQLAAKNRSLGAGPAFLGGGWYDHYVPALVDQMLLRSEFYTAYTPYQPEISQGTLQAIYEFQSLICDLTGLDAANASMYDGASALAEATALSLAATGRSKVVLAASVDPAWRAVVATYLEPLDVEICQPRTWRSDESALTDASTALSNSIDSDTACVAIQRPNYLGWLEPIDAVIAAAREAGAMVIVAGEPVALGLIKPPGDLGVDLAVGELRHLAGAPALGGPGAGYFALAQRYLRRIPGRIAGRTRDTNGNEGYVLTLQTREQHIRRQRASSNICTNQALVALAATIHLCALGKVGLQKLATLSLQNAHRALAADWPTGFAPDAAGPVVREFPLRCPIPAAAVNDHLAERGIVGGIDLGQLDPALDHHLLLAFTERSDASALGSLLGALESV